MVDEAGAKNAWIGDLSGGYAGGAGLKGTVVVDISERRLSSVSGPSSGWSSFGITGLTPKIDTNQFAGFIEILNTIKKSKNHRSPS